MWLPILIFVVSLVTVLPKAVVANNYLLNNQIMFSNNWHISRNGSKRQVYSDNSVSKRTLNNYSPNRKTTDKRVETKIIFSVLSALGITSYITAILLNIGTWKADILFGIAVLFGIVKFIRYTIRTWQDYRRGEIEIKNLQKKSEWNNHVDQEWVLLFIIIRVWCKARSLRAFCIKKEHTH